jgi:hypothetical protein
MEPSRGHPRNVTCARRLCKDASLPGLTGRSWHAPLFVVFAAGCGHSAASAPPGYCPGPAEDATAAIEVQRSGERPSVALVIREGDPRGAVAAVVVTAAGSYASTGLAALLEARLQRAGFAQVASRADRDSFRIRALLDTKERATDLVSAFQKALAQPIVSGSPEMGLVARRIATLKRHPFEAPIVSSIARCTGELGALASEPALDPKSSEGAARLEAVRAAAYGATRVALGAAGSSTFTASVADAVRGADAWPKGSAAETAWPSDDPAGAYAAAGQLAGTARLTLAFSTRRAETAVAASSLVGASEGALIARLRALAVPFRVLESSATTRLRGGCLAVTMETVRPASSSRLEEAAALAAKITRQEIDGARSVVLLGAPRDRSAPFLGSEGTKAVRAANDPREAAELAALWSLTTPASADDKETLAAALALAPPNLDPRDANADLGAQAQTNTQRFSSALSQLEKAWSTPVLEHRDRVEHGQGELWVLVASPCGTAAEGEADSGLSALAVTAALASRGRETRGVTLEPWIAPDGVGVIAHAQRSAGESTASMTARIAFEVARTLVAAPFPSGPFVSARGALLDRVGDGISPDGRALDALAGAVAPGHPSWVAPLGSWDEVAKTGVEGASLRWSALTSGPLRLAVVANDDAQQADAVARAIDRWLVRTTDQPRTCPPVDAPPASRSGTLEVTLSAPPPLTTPLAQALVGFGVSPQGSSDSALAELTLAGLSGADGWVSKALASMSLGATAQARLIGGTRSAALVVDVRAPETQLDAAVAQVRGLFQRLRQGAFSQADLDRSVSLRDKWDLEGSLDPRRRLVDLWRDVRPSAKAVSLDAWRNWAATALRDDKLIVVLARPKRG